MFYSGYLSLLLLQFLNMKLTLTKLIQRAHTTIDGLIDDALFPDNGPVFMQRLHEVHPEGRSSGEKIQRRFGDTYAPETEQTIEAFNDRLINNPEYDYPVSTETPIQILYQSTGYMPVFDNANPYNKDITMLGHNVSLINDYDDYTAIETTVLNVDGNRKYKTMKTDDINALNPSATKKLILFEPNGPTFTPKMYDEYPIASKSSTQGFDFLMDGPDFNPKLYDENLPASTEKNIQRYNDPLYVPFTFQKFDGTTVKTTKIKKNVRKLKGTVLKKFADVFYPELETTAKRSHRTRKRRIKQRSRFTNPITSKTTIQRFIGAQKRRPAFIQQSDYAIKDTTITKHNIPLLNYLAFMQEQRNPSPRDTTVERSNKALRNGPVLVQNYDVSFPKTETTIQRSHRTRKHKPRLKHPRKTKIQRFDGPTKYAPEFEAKVNEDNYPPASDTTNFMENHDLNSVLTETTIQRLKGPIQRRQQNPTKRGKTIQRSNEALRNGPDMVQNFDANLRTTETTIQRSNRTLGFKVKMNEDKYAPPLEATDFRQSLELNSLKIETASQPLRGAPNHKPIFKKEMHETYPQKYETTIQRLKKPLKNVPDFVQKVNEDYPPTLETTDFRQNHDLKSLRTEPASQLFRETQEHKPTFKKMMNVTTYPQKSETTIKRLKKPFRNRPEFDNKVNANNYPSTLKTTDFRQNHDLKSLRTEPASQLFRETLKHKPIFKKEMHETYPQKTETTIQRFKKLKKNGPDFDQKVNVNYYPPTSETKGFRQNHYSPKIETASQPLRGTLKHNQTFIKEMHETYPQKSETTIQRFKKPLRSRPGFDFDQTDNKENYTPALTGPTFKQRFDVTVPHSGNYRGQRLHITPSLPHALKPYEDPLSNLNPSFRSKLKPKIQKPYTMTNLVSPASINQNSPIAETSLVYPWIKTTYPPGSNLESTVSYSPLTNMENPWVTKGKVFPETSKNYYVPPTTLVYEVKPQVLRAPMLESTQLKQETFVDGTTPDQIFAENLATEQDSQDQAESSNPEEDDHTLAESSDPEEDDHTPADSSESEEDEPIELKEEYRGLTANIGLEQETADVAEGEGTDPFSTFLRKLVRVLASKNVKALRNLIQPFGRYVTSLVDTGKLMQLGISTGSFIAQSTPLLHAPLNQIKRYLFVAQLSLENRRRMLDDGTNTLLDEMDDVYDAGEEEAMQRILREITMYPNTSRGEEEIVKDLVDDVFLHPMHRMAGTTQGNVVFEYIGKLCNKYQYGRRNEKPEQYTIIGSITASEDKVISTKNYISTRRITQSEVQTLSFKQDISTTIDTRMEEEKNISDYYSSDDNKYSSGERSQVEIRIRINRGKHYHEDKVCKSRKNCVKINKINFRKFEKDSKRNTTKKPKDTLVGNTATEKNNTDDFESSKTENKGENSATVKVKLDCKHLPVILSDKTVGNGNGTGDPLTEMIMFCSNDKAPDGSDEVSNSSDTSDSDTSSDR